LQVNEFYFLLNCVMGSGITLWLFLYRPERVVTALCLYAVLMNIFVVKQLTVFGLEATAAEPLAVAIALGLNLLREFRGAAAARAALQTVMGASILVTLFAQLMIVLEPSPHDYGHGALLHVFAPGPRIIMASLASFYISDRFELRLFALLQRLCGGRVVGLRHVSSTCLSQALDTVLFTWWGLSGWVENCWSIALFSYCVKLIATAISGPFMQLAATYLRRKDPHVSI